MIHNTHDRREGRLSEGSSRYRNDEMDVDHTSRVDEPRSSRPRSPSVRRYSQRSSSRHEHTMPSGSSSREHYRPDRWRQRESSLYSSNYDRYSHSNTDTYERHHRHDHYDSRSDRHAGSSIRRWPEQTEKINDHSSSSRVDRGWSPPRQHMPYERWDGKGGETGRERDRERDVDRDSYALSENRRYDRNTERGAYRGWKNNYRSRDSAHKHQEATKDSRADSSQVSVDRTWRPAASWEASHHFKDSGDNKTSRKKYNHAQNYHQRAVSTNKIRNYDRKDEINNWRDRRVTREEEKYVISIAPL